MGGGGVYCFKVIKKISYLIEEFSMMLLVLLKTFYELFFFKRIGSSILKKLLQLIILVKILNVASFFFIENISMATET